MDVGQVPRRRYNAMLYTRKCKDAPDKAEILFAYKGFRCVAYNGSFGHTMEGLVGNNGH